jgi:hypothetical protein
MEELSAIRRLDLRAQAKVRSPRRADTPRAIRQLAVRASG